MDNDSQVGAGSARDYLIEMNEGLSHLISEFEGSHISSKDVCRVATMISGAERELLESMPMLLGLPFRTWYTRLTRVDDYASAARQLSFNVPLDPADEKAKIIECVEGARNNADLLDMALPLESGAPPELKRVRPRLARMKEELLRVIREYQLGQYNEHKLRRGLDRAIRAKHEMIMRLPQVAGRLPFSKWYDGLSYMEWAISTAIKESSKSLPEKEAVVSYLNFAKAQEQSLEREIENEASAEEKMYVLAGVGRQDGS